MIYEQQNVKNNHNFGSIIWWTLIRVVFVIIVMWLLLDRFNEYSQWWAITIGAIAAIGIYPAQIQYQKFKEDSKQIIEESLCTSCRWFDPEQLLCKKLDLHVSENIIPCEGEGWEPFTYEDTL
ncbi:MAG: hypothetical protein IPP08_06665 [Chlorobiota bacterium]|nr:hypothetical protein [Chlorobiota bacterium]QQS65470.1 MAG: hypothetical protein IPP08_06665 [Chlorobiota bacterium]